MTVQTSYGIDKVRATNGMLDGGAGHDHEIETVISAQTAAVPFGTLVCRRATPADTVGYGGNPEVTGSVTDRRYGIAVKDETRKNTTGYETNDPMRILRKGRMWVYVEGAVTLGQTLFVRFTTEAPDLQLGTFRADADTDKAVALPGVVALTNPGAAGLCLVDVNLPQ